MNSYVRDPINFLLAPPMARLRQTAAQALATGVWASVLWDTEDVDKTPSGSGGTAVPSTQYTAQYAGWYSVGGGGAFAASATGRRGCRITVNSVVANASAALGPTTAASTCAVPESAEHVYLNVGDICELQLFQDSGGALNTTASAETQSRVNIRWVSS